MDRDLETGDETATAMSPLGLRMLLAALRPSLEQPDASTASRDHLTQELSLAVTVRERKLGQDQVLFSLWLFLF